ncbi:hypothetical protein AXF05_08890 [Staphylococcus aureus]|nr:hypothetical protein [Staphylococcus aureus]
MIIRMFYQAAMIKFKHNTMRAIQRSLFKWTLILYEFVLTSKHFYVNEPKGKVTCLIKNI